MPCLGQDRILQKDILLKNQSVIVYLLYKGQAPLFEKEGLGEILKYLRPANSVYYRMLPFSF